MGQGVLLTADRAREVLDFVDQRKGRPQNTAPYPRKWPILTSTNVAVIRSTSSTANANGYSPALVQSYDPNAKTWTDGTACQANGLYGEQLFPGRYLAITEGATTDGTATYLAVDVLDVELSNGTNIVSQVEVLQADVNWFTVAQVQANIAKLGFISPIGYLYLISTIPTPDGYLSGLLIYSASPTSMGGFITGPVSIPVWVFNPLNVTLNASSSILYPAVFNGFATPAGQSQRQFWYVIAGGWLTSATCINGALVTTSY